MAVLTVVCAVVVFSAGRSSDAGAGEAVVLTERVVVDRMTGLAIGGYDPVAYFTDGAAVLGQAAFEASQGGAVWRFCNENNRTFFLAHPDIYGPQFGGYDPVDLTVGHIVAGRAQVWLVAGGGFICLTAKTIGTGLPLIRRVSRSKPPTSGRRCAIRSPIIDGS